jgi:hypothetical protein
MMAHYWLNRSKSKYLATQIHDAERQVLIRHDRIAVCTTALVDNLHQEMTAPTTLWLAGGFGFILGELTRRQTKKIAGTASKPPRAQTSPVIIALKLLTSIQTLYTALPIAWIFRAFHKSRTATPIPERQSAPLVRDMSVLGAARK